MYTEYVKSSLLTEKTEGTGKGEGPRHRLITRIVIVAISNTVLS